MNQQFGTSMMMTGGLPNGGGQQQGQGFNSFNQGFTNQAQIQRIHQNSLFGGQESQMSGNPQVQRIHQASMQNGTMAQPQVNQYAQNGGGFNQGFANQAFNQGFQNQQLPNGGGQQQNQGFNSFNQGFQNQAFQNQALQQSNNAQLQRIHQNSLFNGQESSFSSPQIQRIHEASMQNGMMAQPQVNQYAQSSGGGFNQGFTNQEFNQGFGGQLPNGGGQQQNQGFGMMMGGQGQGFTQSTSFAQSTIPQQQIDRIHQASLFQGQSQLDNPGLAQIHQRTISGDEANVLRGGFGGGAMMGGMGGSPMGMMGNQGAFRAVMNADQFSNRFDSEGPSAYPASMYTGQNQYDQVNQAVLNQMVGRQF